MIKEPRANYEQLSYFMSCLSRLQE